MEKKLLLIDGSSYLFRAYHAMPPLTTSSGLNCGAIYGVLNMLRSLQNDYPDAYRCVVFDSKEKNFRHELYPEYKANRTVMPEELAEQIEPLHQMIKAMGLTLICLPGVEADDVIGTLAKLGAEKDYLIVISTGDKDMAQLVNHNITLINTMTNTVLDEKGVKNKFGVTPLQIRDYLALVGDTSDNIKGIPKVGPKTAAKWLQEYGSLEEIIANAQSINGKVGESLRENLSNLELSKQLVTIKQDVEISFNLESLHQFPEDKALLYELFTKFEFKTLLRDLENDLPPKVMEKVKYETVLDEESFNRLLKKLKNCEKFAFDVETTDLHIIKAKIVGISFSLNIYEGYYIPLAHDYPEAPNQLTKEYVLKELQPIFKSPDKLKIAHNLKFDYNILYLAGVELNAPFYDTMLASYILNSTANRHDLSTLAKKYLDRKTITFEQVAGKGSKQVTFNKVEIDAATEYAAEDAEICIALYENLNPQIQNDFELKNVFEQIEMPLVLVLADMERYGVLLDKNTLKQQSNNLQIRIEELQKEIYALSGEEFNIDSPKQLQRIFYEKMQLPVLTKTPKGQPSTAEHVLVDLANNYELPGKILDYRSLSKLKSTYADKLPMQVCAKTKRIHAAFHQAITATGRLSSSDPNLQNIPIRKEEGRMLRKAFIAPEGFSILALDYSQIELRIMAHLSKDEGLLNAFAQDKDVHAATASEVFAVSLKDVTDEMRRKAKAINFGLIYGMSSFGLAKQLNVSREEAQYYIDVYFARYPGVKEYMEITKEYARKHGYVKTIKGRRLYLLDINSKNYQRKMAAERMAINAPMQGTAADIIKLAMIKINHWLKETNPTTKMLIQVHDELIFEAPSNNAHKIAEELAKLMSSACKLDVPLKVSIGIGCNWSEAH